ncbi:hypothetical protein Hore_05570 [Halothermothrix orenii H 168]|uniref:Uncharacterized protein n=1 Tax=Halothermothrix orenii (strain H 168 / OCM 544 / DSM 9562) TaxID=373903 RepID=B8D287_HALOH|nr:hypothetical protein Hore_05570 [Halothermothrix orenii H 168]
MSPAESTPGETYLKTTSELAGGTLLKPVFLPGKNRYFSKRVMDYHNQLGWNRGPSPSL